MKLVILVWIITVIQLVLAGVNLGWAMAHPDSFVSIIVGGFCLLVGIFCLWANAYSTYMRGQINEAKRQTSWLKSVKP